MLFPTPKERVLELLGPTPFKASLEEPAVAADPTSSQKSEQLPPFNAYSVDGDVTGPLVYVNYGRPSDYEELARRGISVKGAIVIARYGQSWRGIKPKVAAEHGAIGCLIYSDPRDDGFYVDGVFPDGPMRNQDGVQRGSVMDMPTYPGRSADAERRRDAVAKRLDIKAVTTLTKIPVLPISYGDAQPLLMALGGPVAPGDWRGALPITYRFGPEPGPRASEARLRLESQAREQRHRAAARIDLPGRVDHPRQSSRRVGQRRAGSRQRHVGGARGSARARRARQARAGGRSGRSSMPRGTARSRGCSARPNGSRITSRSCATRRPSTSTPTATAAAS